MGNVTPLGSPLWLRSWKAARSAAAQGRGAWSYGSEGNIVFNMEGGDHSNSQYAVLGLRDAQEYGVNVSTETWKRIRTHWSTAQNPDGGWSYTVRTGGSTGSMTVAGIASMVIVHSMLQDDENEVDEDGKPICCGTPEDDPYLKALERGVDWLTRNFAIGMNPKQQNWQLYYLYGLERAGRLARRFFGQHDWYREGAEYLVARQQPIAGSWKGSGHMEDEIISTSFALLFLSKGLAPVLINKLKYGPRIKTAASLRTIGTITTTTSTISPSTSANWKNGRNC